MTDQKRAYLCGLAAVLLWSTAASAFKITLRYMDYAELLLWASCASTGAQLALLVAQGKMGQVLRSRPADCARSLALGALNPLLYYLILFKAYQLLPAQEAQALNYTWALTLTWLSIPLLGQRIGRRDLLARAHRRRFALPAGSLYRLGREVLVIPSKNAFEIFHELGRR